MAVGLDGAWARWSVPESALIRCAGSSGPAPEVGLYSRFSACCCGPTTAFMTVEACPNASDAPNPAIVWYVVAPLIAAVSAAAAGPAVAPSPTAIRATAVKPARIRNVTPRANPVIVRWLATMPPFRPVNGHQVVQAVPLTEKPVGAASLLV